MLQDRLTSASTALIRGTALLAGRSAGFDNLLADNAGLRAKVVRNRLRELDRLTYILVGELAGRRLAPDDRIEVRRSRDAATRIGRLRAALGVADADQARLLHLRRLRRAPGRTKAAPVPAVDLTDIYAFYAGLTAGLMADCGYPAR